MRDRSSWRLWRRVFRRDPREEVDAELRYHIEERIRDYIDRGKSPDEARRAALERLGNVDRVRAECADLLAGHCRSERRRTSLRVSWLDVKLGFRMLVKYPGLSLVSVFGMAVAIAVGAGAFAFIQAMMEPGLPLEDGDRIIAIQNIRTDESGNPERRVLHDFVMWRDELKSVRELGAFRIDRRNLVMDNGNTDLVQVAEMSAAGFRVARVPALIGRTLLEEDERVGGEPVVVIAEEEWQRRFGGDPGIVGAAIRLGETVHTVVGVMPAGFRFPLNDRYWTPLRLDPADWAHGTGPSLQVFGRLADGVTLRQAQAELSTVGQRMTAQFPETHEQLRPRVMPYTYPFFDVDSPAMVVAMRGLQLFISLLLIVVAVNVAILVYARTTTRLGEIAVRTALGASRRRVLTQLFVEGLVLSIVAAVAGLTVTGAAFGRVEALLDTMAGGELPFWWSLDLSPALIAYVVILAVAAGAIVGVLPALKATSPHIQKGLQQLAARGSRMTLGRTWTMLVVTQVAFVVAILPAAVFWPGALVSFGAGDPGFAIDEFASAWLSMEREENPPTARAAEYEHEFAARFADRRVELLRRLRSEPGVDATFASNFPGRGEPPARIEVEPPASRAASTAATTRDGSPDQRGLQSLGVLVNHVGTDLFEMFDVPVVAGRAFADSDAGDGSRAVIVNRTFADRIGGGANIVGRRLRYAGGADVLPGEPAAGQWYEIVGVVPDFPEPMLPEILNAAEAKLYHPLASGNERAAVTGLNTSGRSLMLIARTRGASVSGLTASLRDITAVVDPGLQLHELSTVASARRTEMRAWRAVAFGILVAAASVVLLSAAGIYAMMSFTVARRRREIGIRTALGADSRRVLSGIFARAGMQLGFGVLIGIVLATILELVSDGLMMSGHAPVILPVAAAVILAVGLLSALGPARRGLSVQPIEVLRED